MVDYCTLAELKAQPGITGTGDDAVLTLAISAAAAAIDAFCNRPDGFKALSVADATTRTYTGSGGPVQFIDECTAVLNVYVKDSSTETTYTAWAATDWIAFSGDPERADFNRTPYTALMVDPNGTYAEFTSGLVASRPGFSPSTDHLRTRGWPTVQVKARWGYANTIPAQVQEANVLQALRWFKRGQSGGADATTGPEFGQLLYRKVLDPDIEMMLVNSRLVRVTI